MSGGATRSHLIHPWIPLLGMALVASWLAVVSPPTAVAAPPGLASGPVFWVNDPGDVMDAAPGDGICWTGGAVLPGTGRLPCTLRAAITEANADGLASAIAFEICPTDFAPNPTGSYTISPGTMPLPSLIDPVAGGNTYVNGYTQGLPQVTPGYDDPAVLALPNPPVACNGGTGIPPRPASPNTTAFSVAMTTVVSIVLDGTICAPVPAAGTITPVPGGFVPSGSIVMWAAPTGGCSGFTLLDNQNVIAGLNIRNWENAGILIIPDPSGSIPPFQNVVWGNFIGTDEDGLSAMGNRFGVEIIGGSTGNYIGETAAIPSFGVTDSTWVEELTPAERNLLSGNDNHPVPDVFHTYGSTCDQGPPPVSGIAFHDDGAGVFLGVDPCLRVTDSKTGDIVLGGAIDNQVRNNYIGTDYTGEDAIPNSNGVWLNFDAGAGTGYRMPLGTASYPGNHIGGCVVLPFTAGTDPSCVPQVDTEQDPNLISGNFRFKNQPTRPDHDGGHGVWINGAPHIYFTPSGSSATFNEIGGNFIGTDGAGDFKLGNSGDGVYLWTPGTSTAQVDSNEIGATSEFVPGLTLGYFTTSVFSPLNAYGFRYPNLISGNGDNFDTHLVRGAFDHGVEIAGSETTDNRVAYGNVIGLDSSGAVDRGNGADGVKVWDEATDNLVHNNSGTGISVAFVVDDLVSSFGAISGNGDFNVAPDIHGVVVSGANTSGNHVFRNCIGGDGDDCGETSLGNLGVGVYLGGNATNNLVGQAASGGSDQRNEIHHNGEDGVRVTGTGSDGNAIRFNTIWRNGDPGGVPGSGNLGIDLNDDGDTANDAGDTDTGPNQEQNHPSSISTTPGVVTFTSCSGCTVDIYGQLQSDSDAPTNRGEGRYWLGSAAATGGSDSVSVNRALWKQFRGISGALCTTLTATDGSNNTSEFSSCVAITRKVSVPTLSWWATLGLVLLMAAAGTSLSLRRGTAAS